MLRFIRITDIVSVALAALLGSVLLLRFLSHIAEIELAPLAAGLVLGYLLADVASGLVHWFCDSYFTPTTPLLGPMLIAPFREHHIDPAALGRHDLFERNGNNCLGSLPFMALGLSSLQPELTQSVLVAFAFTLCFTNQIHAWAHSPRAPLPVRALQRIGVLLSPQHHRRHHQGQRNYAVVSGWSNRALNQLLPTIEQRLALWGVPPSPDVPP